jgi:hypothetical protein
METCIPRKDVLSGDLTDDMYAAHLGLVCKGKALDVYQKPALFFKNTYPTAGLQSVIKDVFSRLGGGKSGAPVIKLETALGGGKTHTLIALYHLAKAGSTAPGAKDLIGKLDFEPVRVAAVIGTQMGLAKGAIGPRTLWGVIAKELFGSTGFAKMKASEEELTSPGEDALFDLIGEERCLILIDELALYLAKAASITVGESTLAKQTVAFLQELTQVASARPNLVVVITSLDKNVVFADETELIRDFLDTDTKIEAAKQVIEDADRILTRLVQNRTPTKGEEFAAVVKHRLFESIDKDEAKKVCEEYMRAYRESSNAEYLPSHAKDPKYLFAMEESYPFHPELINILRTKTSSIVNFNKTRGVLRLLSKVVRYAWAGKLKAEMIHPYHIDFTRQEFIDEIVQRLDKGEYLSALAADIANDRDQPRASRVDQNFSEPLGTRICTTIFLHSITGAIGSDIVHGAKEPEIYLSMLYPGLDLKKAEDALKLCEETCFYLVRQGSTYAFNTEPNLNKIIEGAKDAIEKTKVIDELEDRVRSLFGGKQYFTPIFYANEPSKVSDDTDKPKLVVTHFQDCSIKSKTRKLAAEIRNIYEKQGTQGAPRVFANNLVFLVADEDEIDRMVLKGTEYLALSQLNEDLSEGASYLASISQGQKDRLKKLRQESELYVKIAVVVCYKHLVVPSSQADLEDMRPHRPLRVLSMRVSDSEAKSLLESRKSQEQTIVDFLREQSAARTLDDNELAPDFVIEQLWDKKRDSMTGDEFRKMFYKNPACGLILSDELIQKTLRRGLFENDWVAVLAPILFDKSNYSQFRGGFQPDLQVILQASATAKETLKEYYCAKCGKRKNLCQCEVRCETCGNPIASCTCKTAETCPICLNPKALCECDVQGSLQVADVKLGRAAQDLGMMLDEKGIERIQRVRMRAHGRNALVKLGAGLPQFGKAQIRLELSAVINQRPSGGNYLEFKYDGDQQGYNSIKGLVSNYEGKAQFSAHDLFIDITFPDGISEKELTGLIGTKLAPFTEEELYTLVVYPIPREEKK